MIKAWRLFLVPIVCSLVLLIPVAGIFLYALILAGWYSNNCRDVDSWIHGKVYRKDEYAKGQEIPK